jgi:hypothetical protein
MVWLYVENREMEEHVDWEEEEYADWEEQVQTTVEGITSL